MKLCRGSVAVELMVALLLLSGLGWACAQLILVLYGLQQSQLAWLAVSQRGRFLTVYFRQQCQSKPSRGVTEFQGYQNTFPGLIARKVRRGTMALQLKVRVKGKAKSVYYYIAATRYRDDSGRRVLSLYRQRGHQRRQEQVQGVENMQLHFGVIRGQHFYWLAPQAVQDWRHVKYVAIELLVRSLNTIPSKRTTYRYNGKSHLSHDGHLYQSWLMLERIDA